VSTPQPTEAPRSIATFVVEQIREGIKSGRFSPGQRLIESDLTKELAVSRGPVREALGRLEAEGLVEIAPHRGASVRQMTRKDLQELFVAREFLEGGAARLAAENIATSSLKKALKQELAENRRWTKAADTNGFTAVNDRFHDLIVQVADNVLVANLVGQLQTHVWRLLFLGFVSLDGVRNSSQQHVRIAEAILAGDADAAEQRMRQHIHQTAENALAEDHPLFRSAAAPRARARK
jgi:DNA-binding GntR family transcriptional regulator